MPDLEALKPWIAALVLPPVPLLLLVLFGARTVGRQGLLGWPIVVIGCAGLYLMHTPWAAVALKQAITRPPPALGEAAIAELKRSARGEPSRTLVVVLGAGGRPTAPEYGVSTLKPLSVERLRYGIWLAKEAGLPVAYSGGVGHAQTEGPAEADIAARIAEREFGRKLVLAEAQSRDTSENASRTLKALEGSGVQRLVLVTHDFHMRRAIANFERAASRSNVRPELVAAPIAVRTPGPLVAGDFVPDHAAFQTTRLVLREGLALLAGE
jgi:uncharacterized SAM-binding protein YcdF (DUF218 family)